MEQDQKKLPFKQRSLEEKRKAFAPSMRYDQGNSIPMIFIPIKNIKLPNAQDFKMMAAKTAKFESVSRFLREKMALKSDESLFFYSESQKTIQPSEVIEKINEKYKNKDDGFLYVIYSNIEAHGCDDVKFV